MPVYDDTFFGPWDLTIRFDTGLKKDAALAAIECRQGRNCLKSSAATRR
jgi:hypothetical protein